MFFTLKDNNIGGKTGTAQISKNSSNNALFISFAPFDDPQIAVAVVVEHGGSGGKVSYIGRDIFDEYFFGKQAGVGICLKDVITFSSPQPLSIFSEDFYAPQSYRYISEEQFLHLVEAGC